MYSTAQSSPIPSVAVWLGGLGLLPFIGLAAVVVVDGGELVGTAYTPSRNSMWKWTLRFRALPKRWIKVTAPAWAVIRENPAFLIRCVAMQR